jgi:AraC-like DNA-binding protein
MFIKKRSRRDGMKFEIFEIFELQSTLKNYVESIFYYKNFIPDHSIERVISTGNIFIIFELDNIERNTFDNNLKPNGSFKNAWISGTHSTFINISAVKNSEMLVVQFKPMGASPFIKTPVHFLNDSIQPAENIFGENILKVRNEIMQKPNAKSKFDTIEKWLLQLLDENKTAPIELTDVLLKIQNQPFSKHNELLVDYPKTQKHLIQQFKNYSGLTPKSMHRIIRFNKLLETINQKKEIIWTDIVYETGYADQSHFIKDFQNFCGFNPSEYIKNGYNESTPNFLSLNNEG